jgi:TolB-like protein/tetratricopeptide (TPR) repeat protein/DNA-binding winged helix-turn-helix (wHTH) protein
MDTNDPRGAFRLGEWLVEPDGQRISGPSGTRVLQPEQLALLLALAARHGEAVSRRALREAAWPAGGGSSQQLRAAILKLREVLGGSVRDRRYIVSAGRGGFALIAHLEWQSTAQPAGRSLDGRAIGRLQSFVIELRRRNVFRVAGGYLVGMWLMLQIAETTFQPLHLPEWWMTVLTILAVVGLPIVTVLAWAYEITPGGIILDEGASGGVRLPRARRAIAPAIVAGVALMAAVTGYAWWLTIRDAPVAAAENKRVAPSAQSIAVLSFVDMSPDGEAAYLGDGLSEELSSDLAKLPGLRVAARTSAFAFKGRDLDVRSIGEQLGVRFVLEGSVRREGERVRVTAQLIDASTGFHAWTESYDRPWQDLIAIQQEISGAIAQQLHSVITPELAQQLKTVPTSNPRAYDYYLAGLSEMRQGGGLSRTDEAERLFRMSLEADPGFARAQAGICQVNLTRYERTGAMEHMYSAENACRAALEADATLKETEVALGKLYLASGRPEQAEAVFRSLVHRAPRDADAHIGLGRALARSGQAEEAERSFREAIVVEPGYWAAYNSLGSFLFERGRTDEAAAVYVRVTELAPGNPTGFNNLGAARLAAGKLDAAAEAFEQSSRIEPSRSALSNLGTVYYYLGRLDEAVGMYTKALAVAPEDYKLWGGRADSQWYLPQRRDRAEQDYRRAASLAERSLAVDATAAETWAMLGYFYGRIGDAERGRRYVSRALEIEPDSPYVLYFSAIAAADQGDRERAAALVRGALEHGFSKVLVVADPALKGIPVG